VQFTAVLLCPLVKMADENWVDRFIFKCFFSAFCRDLQTFNSLGIHIC